MEADSTVLFVCTGNTCRSPMTMFAYNHVHEGKKPASFSRALNATEKCMAINAGVALKDANISYGAHMPTTISEEDIRRASSVICMTQSHREALCSRFPQAKDKVRLLLGDKDLDDPLGQPLDVYKSTLAQILPAVRGLWRLYVDVDVKGNSCPFASSAAMRFFLLRVTFSFPGRYFRLQRVLRFLTKRKIKLLYIH